MTLSKWNMEHISSAVMCLDFYSGVLNHS